MMDLVAFKTLIRPKSPNTYLLAPAGLCEASEPDKISQAYALSPTDLFATMREMIETQKGWVEQSSDPARGLIHAVATTKLMRYKDDIDILILPGEAGSPATIQQSRLAIYSRSRIGHSDLGANRKRVTFMLNYLHKMQNVT